MSNHEGHEYHFKPSVNGCCDCGDVEAWNPAGFCTNHKGFRTDTGEVDAIIANSFSAENIDKFELLFENMLQIHKRSFLLHSFNQVNKVIPQLLELIEEISASSISFSHLVSRCITKELPIENPNAHTCITFSTDFQEKTVKMNYTTSDICVCPFIATIMSKLDNQTNARIKNKHTLYSLLCDVRFKYNFGFYYFVYYYEQLNNGSELINSISVQVTLNTDMIEMCLRGNQIFSVWFDSILRLVELENISAENFQNNISQFRTDFSYIFKKKSCQKLFFEEELMDKLIEIANVFDATRCHNPENSNLNYLSGFLVGEVSVLQVFSTIINYHDFDLACNKNYMNFLYKLARNALAKKPITPYYYNNSNIRIISYFVLRYGLFLSMMQNIPTVYGLKQIVNTLIETLENAGHGDAHLRLINKIMCTCNFNNSIQLGLWQTHGIFMQNYPANYYSPHVYGLFKEDLLAFKLLLLYEKKVNLRSWFLTINLEKESHANMMSNTIRLVIQAIMKKNFLPKMVFKMSEEYYLNKKCDVLQEFFIETEGDNINNYITYVMANEIMGRLNESNYSDATTDLPFFINKRFKNELVEITKNTFAFSQNADKHLELKVPEQLFHFIDVYNYFAEGQKNNFEKYSNDYSKEGLEYFVPHYNFNFRSFEGFSEAIESNFMTLENATFLINVLKRVKGKFSELLVNVFKFISLIYQIREENDDIASIKEYLAENIDTIREASQNLQKKLHKKSVAQLLELIETKGIFEFNISEETQQNAKLNNKESEENIYKSQRETRCLICYEDFEDSVDYGNLGFSFVSKNIYHSFNNIIKQETGESNEVLPFKDVRIFTCTHRLCFGCFDKLSTDSLGHHNQVQFKCPYCSSKTNCIFPTVSRNFLTIGSNSPVDFVNKTLRSNKKIANISFEKSDTLSVLKTTFMESIVDNMVDSVGTSFLMKDYSDRKNEFLYSIKNFFYNFLLFQEMENFSHFIDEFESVAGILSCFRHFISKDIIQESDLTAFYTNLISGSINEGELSSCIFGDNLLKEFFKIILTFVALNIDPFVDINGIIEPFVPFLMITFFLTSNVRPTSGQEVIKGLSNSDLFVNCLNFLFKKLCYIKFFFVCPEQTAQFHASIRNETDQVVLAKTFVDILGLNVDSWYSDTNVAKIQEILDGLEKKEYTNLSLYLKSKFELTLAPIEKTLLEFNKRIREEICDNCKTATSSALYCLLCGQKVCFETNCCEIAKGGAKMGEVFWHTRTCGEGTIIFLYSKNGRIYYSANNIIIRSIDSPYRNVFGEILKSAQVSDEFALNEEALKKIKKKYLSASENRKY